MQKNKLEQIFEKDRTPESYLKYYGRCISDLLLKLNFETIGKVINIFLQARKHDSTIFFAGNGGSASTASHFAQDLAEVGRKSGKKHFRTLSIADNVSFITAMGNDYGYEKIFTGQMANLFKKGDILVAISASGNSPNILEAVKFANDLGGITIGLVGFDGGKLKKQCNFAIHVETEKGEYGPVEDVHLMIDHMITSYLILRDKS